MCGKYWCAGCALKFGVARCRVVDACKILVHEVCTIKIWYRDCGMRVVMVHNACIVNYGDA
jgi:hypothetical protein